MKIVLEIHINDLGAISAILDQAAPNHPVTKMVDDLFLKVNNLPREIISIDRNKR